MDIDESTDNASATGCPAETEDAGYAKMCEGCPGRTLCQSQGAVDPAKEEIDVRMNAIKHKILVVSGKGGVGKSSIATTLSISLANLSQKVALLDLDICGPSIPKLMAVEDKPVINSNYGWKPLVSPHSKVKVMSVGSLLESSSNSITFRGPRKTNLIKRFLKDTFWGRLDYLVCDTPPGTSDEHLTVISAMKTAKLDGAIIVSTPQTVALGTIKKEISFCRKMGVRILGIIENMSGYVCPCCGELAKIFSYGGVESLCQQYDITFLGRIPMDSTLVSTCENGGNIFTDHPNSPATKSLVDIAKSVHDMLS